MLSNLRAVIKAYETGQMPSSDAVYFKEGEIVESLRIKAEVKIYIHVTNHIEISVH
jgi:hypothetical protein